MQGDAFGQRVTEIDTGWAARRSLSAATLWRPVPPLRYLEVEIEHLMRMDGIAEAARAGARVSLTEFLA